jgi:hypothetical protein
MGIKTPTQLVSTLAKTFTLVIGIVVELLAEIGSWLHV